MEENLVYDRRAITGDDLRSLLDMCKGLVDSVHIHDRDIAVLKTRMDGTEERLARIESDVRDTRALVQQVLDRLTAHTAQEDKDRKNLFLGVISTLLTTLGAVLWAFLVQPQLGK